MFSSSDLLQVRDAFMKLSKASERVKNWEPEVDLGGADHTNAPFCIMVPEQIVPVVEWLRHKEFRGVWERPIPVKWTMYAIQSLLFGCWDIWVKVPGAELLLKSM